MLLLNRVNNILSRWQGVRTPIDCNNCLRFNILIFYRVFNHYEYYITLHYIVIQNNNIVSFILCYLMNDYYNNNLFLLSDFVIQEDFLVFFS